MYLWDKMKDESLDYKWVTYKSKSGHVTGSVGVNSTGDMLSLPPIWGKWQGQKFDEFKKWVNRNFTDVLII